MTFENGLKVAIASDLLNIIFIFGGHKLARFAKKKQIEYFENGGSDASNMHQVFVWFATLGMGLIVAWFFPVKFHEAYCNLTGFDYRIGLVAKATQVILVTQMLYIAFKAPIVILPIGKFFLLFVMPICLIYGHYFQ